MYCFATYLTSSSECCCNGVPKCISFTYHFIFVFVQVHFKDPKDVLQINCTTSMQGENKVTP